MFLVQNQLELDPPVLFLVSLLIYVVQNGFIVIHDELIGASLPRFALDVLEILFPFLIVYIGVL